MSTTPMGLSTTAAKDLEGTLLMLNLSTKRTSWSIDLLIPTILRPNNMTYLYVQEVNKDVAVDVLRPDPTR